MSPQDDPTLHQTAWLFTRQNESVRLELRSAAAGVTLLVFGPGSRRASHDFPDDRAQEGFRTEFEQDLIARGFRLMAVAERRDGADRRGGPRPGSRDRRQ